MIQQGGKDFDKIVADSPLKCLGGPGCKCCGDGCDCGCRNNCPQFRGFIMNKIKISERNSTTDADTTAQ